MKNKISYYTQYLRQDSVSGFFVFLIALPLCLGIAKASGFPPIAGIYTAVIGGLVVTFLSNSQLTIKGPAAGLIVIALASVEELGNGNLIEGYKLTLAVGVFAGIIQILFGLLKFGKYTDFFPSSVIHGMMAAIGVIIISKQIHVSLGVVPNSKETLDLIKEIPFSLTKINPEVAFIGALSLLILFLLPTIKSSYLIKIPAPLVVLLFALPLSYYFDLSHDHDYDIATLHFHIDPKQILVALPNNFFNGFTLPDFSKISSPITWKYVFMFAIVGNIESLLSAKAIDSLDTLKRKTNMNRDIVAVGIGNVISSLIGGLPMISEIVRSSANINAGAKTKMSNFFHGFFLFSIILIATPIIQKIPNAALASMLIYTGYKLSSPKMFKEVLDIGFDQFMFFIVTFIVTLSTDLLLGVFAGIFTKIMFHFYHGGKFNDIFKFRYKKFDSHDGTTITILSNAVFTNYLGFKKMISSIEKNKQVKIDFSLTKIVDHSFLENVHQMHNEFHNYGGSVEETGFEKHNFSSYHPHSSRVMIKNPLLSHTNISKLNKRQFAFNLISIKHKMSFEPYPSVNFMRFNLSDHTLIRASKNCKNLVFGKHSFYKVYLMDIEYENYDGLTKSEEEFTVAVISDIQGQKIPNFVLSKQNFLSTIENVRGNKDIFIEISSEFSKAFYLYGEQRDEIKNFFNNNQLTTFLLKYSDYHIECNSNSIIIYKNRKLLQNNELDELLVFIEEYMLL